MKSNQEIINDVYKKYKNSVNMTYTELKIWSKNKLSNEASLDRRPIKRNLILLNKNKKDWNMKNIKAANKVISYLARAKKIKSKNYIPGTKLTYNDVALRNWGFDKFKK